MEIKVRIEPSEVAEMASALLVNEDLALRFARAASGAAVALAGGLKFAAKPADEDPDVEFDRFVAWLARHGTISGEDLVKLIRRHDGADEPGEGAADA